MIGISVPYSITVWASLQLFTVDHHRGAQLNRMWDFCRVTARSVPPQTLTFRPHCPGYCIKYIIISGVDMIVWMVLLVNGKVSTPLMKTTWMKASTQRNGATERNGALFKVRVHMEKWLTQTPACSLEDTKRRL